MPPAKTTECFKKQNGIYIYLCSTECFKKNRRSAGQEWHVNIYSHNHQVRSTILKREPRGVLLPWLSSRLKVTINNPNCLR